MFGVWEREEKDSYYSPPEGGRETLLSEGDSSKQVHPKKINKMDLFHGDMIFHNQKVHVGDVRRHSRHFVVEAINRDKVSAVPTQGLKPTEKTTKPTGVYKVEIHLPYVDVVKAGRIEITVLPQLAEITQSDLQEQHQTLEDIVQTEELEESDSTDGLEDQFMNIIQTEELEESDSTDGLEDQFMNIIQTEELDEVNIEVLSEEVMDEIKDKSIRRRFLNWLSELLRERFTRKITRTYRREQEEGSQIYLNSECCLTQFVLTRAEREQQKRQELLRQEKQRQKVKKLLDAHWEAQRSMKEAQRLKEEERYERWASEHGLSVPASLPEQPKKRMNKWKKRFLRAIEFSRRSVYLQ